MLDTQYENLFNRDSDMDELKREYETLYIAHITSLEAQLRSKTYYLRVLKGEAEAIERTSQERIKKCEAEINSLNQQKLSTEIARRRSNG